MGQGDAYNQLDSTPGKVQLMQVSPSIFKAYDIRGEVPTTITEALAEALGKAFGTVALKEGEKTVAVGRDGSVALRSARR